MASLNSNYITAHEQTRLCHQQATLPTPFFPAIEKQVHLCNAMEHLESSGTKVFMNGPIVCNLKGGAILPDIYTYREY